MKRRSVRNAFVTDGDQRSALAVVRALGRRGISVVVGEERSASLASASRYCDRHVIYPSPSQQPGAFKQFLQDYVAREHVDVVMPVTDVTTHLISSMQERLEKHCAVATPPFEAFERVSNKWSLIQLAGVAGVPVPRTHFVDGSAALDTAIGRVEYPAVVKPIRSRIPTSAGWISTSVAYANSNRELRDLYRRTGYLRDCPSLIQERIVGPGVGVFVLFDRGELLAACAHRRIREKPPSGGPSVLRESIPVDAEARRDAQRLLGPLGWHGVAMLEYKHDCRSGRLCLMEVNGRFWGSLQLAIDAGLDFPYFSYQLASGQRPAVPDTYQVGVQSRWLLGDLDHLLLRLFKNDGELPMLEPSRLRAIVEFLKFWQPGVRYEVVRRDDLGPFHYELRHYIADLLAGTTRRIRARAARFPFSNRALRPSLPS